MYTVYNDKNEVIARVHSRDIAIMIASEINGYFLEGGIL